MLRELPPPSADHKTGHTKSLANPLPETSPNTQPLLFNMNIFTKINIYINIDIFTFTCKRRKSPRIGDLYSSSIQHLHFLQSDIHASICCLFFSLCIFHIRLFSFSPSCPVCIKTHTLIYTRHHCRLFVTARADEKSSDKRARAIVWPYMWNSAAIVLYVWMKNLLFCKAYSIVVFRV